MELRVRRYKYGYSPCYMSRRVDMLVHRTLPRALRVAALRLEHTSPRWGWRARMEYARAQHTKGGVT